MQGVGLYNNLLNGEDSSENNNEESETEKFNESNLYSVNSLGYYEIVERASDVENGTAEKVTVENNRVYCCGKPTIYDYYGKIIVAPYTFSTTSEFANLVFILKGPFYADITEVTITYDQSIISVQRYPESLKQNSYLQPVTDGAEMEQIPSGGSVKINNNEHYIPVKLRIKRANFSGSDVVPELITSITLNNGFEDTIVKIHFCETILFYKDGVGFNGFDPNNIVLTKQTMDGAGKIDPVVNHFSEGNSKYIYFSSQHKRFMWIYNPEDPSRSALENKVIIDYSKNVKFYCRVHYNSSSNNSSFRWISLANNPLVTNYEPIGDGTKEEQNIFNRSNVIQYLRQWPSFDGSVISKFYSYANCYPKDAVCEKKIAVGGPSTVQIAEIGLLKYNDIELNGWEL